MSNREESISTEQSHPNPTQMSPPTHICVRNGDVPKKMIPYPCRSFISLLRKSSAVVDKTGFALKLVELAEPDLSEPYLITSPKHTGKSMLLDSGRFFFEAPLQEFFDQTFEGWVQELKVLIDVIRCNKQFLPNGSAEIILKQLDVAFASVRLGEVQAQRMIVNLQGIANKGSTGAQSSSGMAPESSESIVMDRLTQAISLLQMCFGAQFIQNGDSYSWRRDQREQLLEGWNRQFTVLAGTPTSVLFRSNHYGRHPVVFLDMKPLGGSSYSDLKRSLAEVVAAEFSRHDYLFYQLRGQNQLEDAERYQTHMNGKGDETQLGGSVQFLCRLLFRTYTGGRFLGGEGSTPVKSVSAMGGNQRPLVFVDDYDTTINDVLLRLAPVTPERADKKRHSKELADQRNGPTQDKSPEAKTNETYDAFVRFYVRFLYNSTEANKEAWIKVVAGELPIQPQDDLTAFSTQGLASNIFSRFLMFRKEEFDELARFYFSPEPNSTSIKAFNDKLNAAKRWCGGYIVDDDQKIGLQFFHNKCAFHYLNCWELAEPIPLGVEDTLSSRFYSIMKRYDVLLKLLGESENLEPIYCRPSNYGLYAVSIRVLRAAVSKYEMLTPRKEETFVQLLFHLGCVIHDRQCFRNSDGRFQMVVPNEMMRQTLRDALVNSLKMGNCVAEAQQFKQSLHELLLGDVKNPKEYHTRRLACEEAGTQLFQKLGTEYSVPMWREAVFEFFLHHYFEGIPGDPQFVAVTQAQTELNRTVEAEEGANTKKRNSKDKEAPRRIKENQSDLTLWDIVTRHASLFELKRRNMKTVNNEMQVMRIIVDGFLQCHKQGYSIVFDQMHIVLAQKLGRSIGEVEFTRRSFISALLTVEDMKLTMRIIPAERISQCVNRQAVRDLLGEIEESISGSSSPFNSACEKSERKRRLMGPNESRDEVAEITSGIATVGQGTKFRKRTATGETHPYGMITAEEQQADIIAHLPRPPGDLDMMENKTMEIMAPSEEVSGQRMEFYKCLTMAQEAYYHTFTEKQKNIFWSLEPSERWDYLPEEPIRQSGSSGSAHQGVPQQQLCTHNCACCRNRRTRQCKKLCPEHCP